MNKCFTRLKKVYLQSILLLLIIVSYNVAAQTFAEIPDFQKRINIKKKENAVNIQRIIVKKIANN